MTLAAAIGLAVAIWWTANTVAHMFIHRPFAGGTAHLANTACSFGLSALLGIPQALWRQRHLAHHGSRPWRLETTPQLVAEVLLVLAVWTMLVSVAPAFFAFVYLPGYLTALGLCAVQGHYEHARGATSCYDRVYNTLCFNDGYHAEHHAHPGLRWTELPAVVAPGAHVSRWPPVLRWLDDLRLDTLERIVVRSRLLQRFVLRAHRRALAGLLPALPPVAHAAIVGGGLFPRTALILGELLPDAHLVIIDADASHLEMARALVGGRADLVHRRYRSPDDVQGVDLVVFPLAFDGDRRAIYDQPPARAVLVHDWIWRRRGRSRIVSPALLKRINLVRRCER